MLAFFAIEMTIAGLILGIRDEYTENRRGEVVYYTIGSVAPEVHDVPYEEANG